MPAGASTLHGSEWGQLLEDMEADAAAKAIMEGLRCILRTKCNIAPWTDHLYSYLGRPTVMSRSKRVARLTVWKGVIAVDRRTHQMAYLSRLTEVSQRRLIRTLWKNDRLGQVLVVGVGSVTIVTTLAVLGWMFGFMFQQRIKMPTSRSGEIITLIMAVIVQVLLASSLATCAVRSVASWRIRRLLRALGDRDVCCHCLHELSSVQEVCTECGRPVERARPVSEA